eukprot:SAG31_NODE_675_length_12908_cov_11.596612_13_plen_153_part_00
MRPRRVSGALCSRTATSTSPEGKGVWPPSPGASASLASLPALDTVVSGSQHKPLVCFAAGFGSASATWMTRNLRPLLQGSSRRYRGSSIDCRLGSKGKKLRGAESEGGQRGSDSGGLNRGNNGRPVRFAGMLPRPRLSFAKRTPQIVSRFFH